MTIDAVLDELLAREGDFVADPVDRGSFTRYGITAATLGEWRGMGRQATRTEVENLPRIEAKAIYIARYIDGPGFVPANVPDEALRVALIDDGVNSGPFSAVKRLQRVLGVSPDGVLGPETVRALSQQDPQKVRVEIVKARCLHYARIVQQDVTQVRFIAGWLSRALSFL